MFLPAVLGLALIPKQQDIENRVEATLAKMTLDQKVDVISGCDGYVSRAIPEVGIPRMRWSDGPVGVRTSGPTTAYPATVGLAASFDPKLAQRFGVAIGRDARSRADNVWFAPGVNLSRVPQNGRNFEYLGEDPLLASRIVVPIIKGVQSQGVSATVKHFAGNEYETDRGIDNSVVDERTLRELYFKPFEAAVKEANVGCVMCAYNKVNGTYCSENDFLLNKVLKTEWGFRGVLVSDYGATHSTLPALKAGLDIELPGGEFLNRKTVEPLVQSGQLSMAELDDKVRRFLRLVYTFGFADRPQLDNSIPRDDPENEQVALQIAREGTVLLKNRGSLLPLDRYKKQRIVVVGPNADPAVTGGGGSSYTNPASTTSLLAAIKKEAGPNTDVEYRPLIGNMADTAFGFTGFTTPDGQPGLRMEHWENMTLEGPPTDTSVVPTISVKYGENEKLHFSNRWTGSVKFDHDGAFIAVSRSDDGIKVWLDDRVIIDHFNNHGPVIDTATIEVRKGHTYRLRVDYFQDTGSAVAQFGFAPAEGELVQPAVRDEIKKADVVIASVGFNLDLESEGYDRPFELPLPQELLLRKVAALNPHTIVVNNSGAGVDMSAWVDKVGGLIQAWYPGGNGSQAIGEILFGFTNPSGKLPTSFPRTLKGTYYETAHPPVNHTEIYSEGLFMGYRWFDAHKVAPLFPFGFGLSYTSFSEDRCRVTTDGHRMEVSVHVQNTGRASGTETMQVYVHAPGKAVLRPEQELKGFQRVTLTPGESKDVLLEFPYSDLMYFDVATHSWKLESGEYQVRIGSSSRDLPLRANIRM